MYQPRSLPPELKADLQAEQFQILRTQVPILYAVLTINTCILGFSIHGLAPVSLSIVAPACFLGLIAIRAIMWLFRRNLQPDPARIGRYLTNTTLVAALVALALGIWGVALLESTMGDKPFVPLFMALGSVACSFCLASLPRAAFATIILATMPVIVWLLFSGLPVQISTGLNLLLIFGLILRLVIHQYDYLVDRVITHAQVRSLAYADPLTKLPNRTLFAQRLDQSLREAERLHGHVGLVVLDVDHFKTVNDAMGHAAGDALLQEISARLLRAMPANGTVARLGGDEFAIILPGLVAAPARIDLVHAMLRGLDQPMLFEGQLVNASVSAGAAMWPADGSDAESLLKSADLALYAAKARGGGAIRGFAPAMRQGVERRTAMLSEARTALKEDRIFPFYQPKIRLMTGEVVGFEALLRWHHPQRGMQLPETIRAALEDNEFAAQLTDRMMDLVFADMRDWLQAGVSFGKIALNGAPADFLRGAFADRLLGRLERFDVPASLIELEVTESVFFGQLAESVGRTLKTLSAAGATIALDDFGTGYASLSHLKQFPVDVLKIDRSFVSKLTDGRDEEDAAIVGAVLNLAQNLGIMTVAEGIETQAQAAYLRRKGCDLGQGYLFSHAVPTTRVPELIDCRYPPHITDERGAAAFADRTAAPAA
ncbi:MAG: Phytochrome-like protein cph2 [Sphingomonas bacterium]|uniref:putative bifunctional diguanylate cyclase/phosphodiesterase n=1 Tax=Sphingomonas bacterium TaxID=1895847 RepID=UPI0026031F83|nr:EAL domain-containing protein [Sphingomonas bacterium]MDB5706628.1 Phytochrome-like protein cph2 [Sphingomonas bacterium]